MTSKYRIKFGDVRLNNFSRQHVQDCLDSNWLTCGPKVAEFEKRWTKLCGTNHAVCVNSGTSADIAMCAALYEFGAKLGDEVIVPALTFVATWNAVLACGLIPVMVDTKLDTLGIDETLIEKAVTWRTRAIMPVSLMGKPYKADVIQDIAHKHGLFVLGDHCESHLARYKGKLLDEYTDVSAYSFYSAHLSFSVEQGACVTNSSSFRDTILSVRSHGRSPNSLDFNFHRFGLNLKPTDLHASVGLGNLETIVDDFNSRKIVWYAIDTVCRQYEDLLYLIKEEDGETICPHAYSITFKTPSVCKVFKQCLDEAGIQYKDNFGSCTKHDAFLGLGHSWGDFKNAEFTGENGVHVPTHQYLTANDVGYMQEVIGGFLSDLRYNIG